MDEATIRKALAVVGAIVGCVLILALVGCVSLVGAVL